MRISTLFLICTLAAPAAAQVASDFRDPDPRALLEGERPLLADRNDPNAYPTLATRGTNAIDGANAAEALSTTSADSEARALFTALADMNCRISERDVAERLGPLGFEPGFVSETLATLYIQGVASLDAQGNLTLPASICPPDEPAPSPRDRVITALRDNGCSASEEQILASPGISGLTEPQLLAILGPMRDRGEVELGTLSATLSPELCRED